LASIGAALLAAAAVAPTTTQSQGGPAEARTGFTLTSNGHAEEFCANQAALTDSPNSPQIPADECSFDTAVEEFTGPETLADGLGPVFNAEGCGSCHLVPILGGTSQIMEKRVGRFDGQTFFDPPGGSLLQDRAIPITLQEFSAANNNVSALRGSISVLGDGFVEAIANGTLQNIANGQPAGMRGTLINVPVFERPGTTRVGRFGWKDQQASLVSFSADAYVNEMGITSPLQPDENTSNGVRVGANDTAPPGHPDDPNFPDNNGVDVELFALLMRSTLAPPRGTINANVNAGSTLFNQIGCAVCHTPTIDTAAPGQLINGGALRVSNALGNKRIHPFGDFLMHDIGTGDGIVQNGGQASRNRVRTAPLWGLRARGRFMHDSLSFNLQDAIRRHTNQAEAASDAFNALSSTNRQRVLDFLLSL